MTTRRYQGLTPPVHPAEIVVVDPPSISNLLKHDQPPASPRLPIDMQITKPLIKEIPPSVRIKPKKIPNHWKPGKSPQFRS